MKAEERAFLRALAAWHGGSDYAAPNPAAARAAQALNKAIADQPPYWERCACRGSGPSCGVPTCERHQRGALSVSGEAPPKGRKWWCAKCRRPWKQTPHNGCCAYCGHGWNQDWEPSAPPPEKEPRPYLGHDAPVAPTPKEPPAPMGTQGERPCPRCDRYHMGECAPSPETRSVEEILRRVFGALAAEPTPHVRAEMRCDIAEALRLHLRAGVPEGRSEWVLKAEADEKIAALRAERDEARERARGGGS